MCRDWVGRHFFTLIKKKKNKIKNLTLQPFWLNTTELMQVFPMILMMVLLHLGHRVQKLLHYLLVLKTKHTLCSCIYQGICALHFKVCHSSNCFQDILQTNEPQDKALIMYQTAHCFMCKGVVGRRQQNRLSIGNLLAADGRSFLCTAIRSRQQ